MFVVLTIQREERGLLARAADWLGKGPLEVRRRSFLGNGYYHIIDHTGGRPHWELLAQAVGRAATRLVVAGEEEPPRGSGLRLYDPAIFAGRMTAMAGAQLLRELPDRGRQTTVALVDEDGLFTWCAGELARRCALLRVYTRRPDRYTGLCRELMEGEGASLVLADGPEGLRESRFAVSPAPTGVWRLPMPVVTVDRSGIQGRPTLNRLEPDLAPELEETIPPGVPLPLFLGAAWETGLRRFPWKRGKRQKRQHAAQDSRYPLSPGTRIRPRRGRAGPDSGGTPQGLTMDGKLHIMLSAICPHFAHFAEKEHLHHGTRDHSDSRRLRRTEK